MSALYVALVHYPVYDRTHRVVTSSVTNIDVHDIARSCRTYGADGFYVVTPVPALRSLVRRIMRHWEAGAARDYNPTRTDALSLVRLVPDLEGVEMDIENRHGSMPIWVGTSARPRPEAESFAKIRQRIDETDEPVLVLLGTGWGMTDEVFERCRWTLEPLEGPSDYNHLSVRAAAAVILDRLRSKISDSAPEES